MKYAVKSFKDQNPPDGISEFEDKDSPPYTFFLLNGDMELHRDWQIFV